MCLISITTSLNIINMSLSPAETVIKAFGGIHATARAIGRTPGAISFWRAKGNVPGGAQKLVLIKARELNLDLSAEDLIFGREV